MQIATAYRAAPTSPNQAVCLSFKGTGGNLLSFQTAEELDIICINCNVNLESQAASEFVDAFPPTYSIKAQAIVFLPGFQKGRDIEAS
jgi:hypothetical protein